MRSLYQTLQDQDAGFLRVIAEQWGLELPRLSTRELPAAVVIRMLAEGAFDEQVEGLAPDTHHALLRIEEMGGKIPRHEIERDLGSLHVMGPARRDREKPWRNPSSPLDDLWYRGLIGTAFADTKLGPIEFIYIPLEFTNPRNNSSSEPLLYGHSIGEPPIIISTSTTILDDCTTVLALARKEPDWIRMDQPDWYDRIKPFLYLPQAFGLIHRLLSEMGVLAIQPKGFKPEPVRDFLLRSPDEALQSLVDTWRASRTWNDLAEVPGITAPQEEWPNDPLRSREAVLGYLSTIPLGEWWDIESFTSAIHKFNPDFQRPAGDFSSWYLQQSDGTFLTGWEHWDAVEGAMIRFILTGSLHWLGVVDIGRGSESGPVTAFRFSPNAATLYGEDRVIVNEEANLGVITYPDGTLVVPRDLLRSQRYQIARFSDWIRIQSDGYTYRISARSLEKAAEQGLKSTHILSVLEETCSEPIPPKLIDAIQHWFKFGTTASLDEVIVLRIDERERKILQKRRTVARLMGEEIGPNMFLVRRADWPRLVDAALREGILIHPPDAS
jgi:hypothetical protein